MTIAVVALCLLWAVIIPSYWFTWLRSSPSDDGHPTGYVTHERAFLLPDLTLAALLATSGILALLGSPALTVTGLIAAGMMLFLGLIDLGYDLGNRANAWEFAGDALLIASAATLIALVALITFASTGA